LHNFLNFENKINVMISNYIIS